MAKRNLVWVLLEDLREKEKKEMSTILLGIELILAISCLAAIAKALLRQIRELKILASREKEADLSPASAETP